MNYNKETLSRYVNSQINDIDVEMIPILIELNSKGYRTLFCCQGHTEKTNKNQRCSIYISFNNKKEDFEFFPKQYDRNGNKKYSKIKFREKNSNYNININTTLYYYTSKTTKYDKKENERKEIINLLYSWAKDLPSLL